MREKREREKKRGKGHEGGYKNVLLVARLFPLANRARRQHAEVAGKIEACSTRWRRAVNADISLVSVWKRKHD